MSETFDAFVNPVTWFHALAIFVVIVFYLLLVDYEVKQ